MDLLAVVGGNWEGWKEAIPVTENLEEVFPSRDLMLQLSGSLPGSIIRSRHSGLKEVPWFLLWICQAMSLNDIGKDDEGTWTLRLPIKALADL